MIFPFTIFFAWNKDTYKLVSHVVKFLSGKIPTIVSHIVQREGLKKGISEYKWVRSKEKKKLTSKDSFFRPNFRTTEISFVNRHTTYLDINTICSNTEFFGFGFTVHQQMT